MGLADFSVPDTVGPLVGWRYWYVDRGRLRSLNGLAYTPWPERQPLGAECRALAGHRRRAPADGCRCGIYAASDLETLRRLVHPGLAGPLAVGEVSLWGRVVPGERGYRAQSAYPRRVWLVRESLMAGTDPEGECRALEEAYGVPVGVCSATWALAEENPEVWTVHPSVARPSRLLAAAAGRAAAIGLLGVLGARLVSDPAAFLGAWALGSSLVLGVTCLGFGAMTGRVGAGRFVAVSLALPLLLGAVLMLACAGGGGCP